MGESWYEWNEEEFDMTNTLTGAESVRWDLSILYTGLNDPRLEADIAALVDMQKAFHAAHKNNLSQTLAKAVADYAEIHMLWGKIAAYMGLRQSTDVADAAIKAKVAEVDTVLSRSSGEYLTFFCLELVTLDDAMLAEWYATDPIAAKHRPWIEQMRLHKPHLLSEPVESALTKRSPFECGAWSEFFEELEADLEFLFRGEKRILTEMLHVLRDSKDAAERFEAMGCINAGLKGSFAKYAAQTLWIVAGSGAVERRERSYRHPMDARNKSNLISDAVVDALHDAVTEVAAPLAQRYYRLKAAHLGLSTMRWSDRNASLPFSDTTTMPFEEAMDIVFTAYQSFSPTLACLIGECMAERRIDAPAVKGKRSGAFNASIVLPGGVPVSFTLLNYLGSSRDAMTLAHELGHAGHGLLAGKAQGALMYNAPIAYAETASVFGENVTFSFLREKLAKEDNPRHLLALLMGKIEDILNTTVRQIGFSNFERRLHGMDPLLREWREPKKLSVEELNGIWLETLEQLYGKAGDVFTYENADHLWTYVHHFHSPFYVYGYAFGELLTQCLYAQWERLGNRFEPLYLDLLRAGGTKNATELLEPFGLDPSRKQFWIDGICVGLGAMVKEAEELSRTVISS